MVGLINPEPCYTPSHPYSHQDVESEPYLFWHNSLIIMCYMRENVKIYREKGAGALESAIEGTVMLEHLMFFRNMQ